MFFSVCFFPAYKLELLSLLWGCEKVAISGWFLRHRVEWLLFEVFEDGGGGDASWRRRGSEPLFGVAKPRKGHWYILVLLRL